MNRPHATWWPYPPYAWRVARNSAFLWVLLRLVVLALARTALPSPRAGALLVVVAGVLVWLDGRRFHEHHFHANLGTSPAWATGIGFAAAGVLELVAQLVLRHVPEGNAAALLG